MYMNEIPYVVDFRRDVLRAGLGNTAQKMDDIICATIYGHPKAKWNSDSFEIILIMMDKCFSNWSAKGITSI